MAAAAKQEVSTITKFTRRLLHRVGGRLRAVGRSIDEQGCGLQGIYASREHFSRVQQFQPLGNVAPSIGEQVFVAPSANLVGDVSVGAKSSIWYGATLRGDMQPIEVGERTNIQDRAVLHVAKQPKPFATRIGNLVSIGHRAVVHAATVHDESVVGMGAIVLDGCVISKHAYLAPGSMLLAGSKVPEGQLWAGAPARFVRQLSSEEIERIISSAEDYILLAEVHQQENRKDYAQVELDRLKRKIMEERTPEASAISKTQGRELEFSEAQARLDMEARSRHFGPI